MGAPWAAQRSPVITCDFEGLGDGGPGPVEREGPQSSADDRDGLLGRCLGQGGRHSHLKPQAKRSQLKPQQPPRPRKRAQQRPAGALCPLPLLAGAGGQLRSCPPASAQVRPRCP